MFNITDTNNTQIDRISHMDLKSLVYNLNTPKIDVDVDVEARLCYNI